MRWIFTGYYPYRFIEMDRLNESRSTLSGRRTPLPATAGDLAIGLQEARGWVSAITFSHPEAQKPTRRQARLSAILLLLAHPHRVHDLICGLSRSPLGDTVLSGMQPMCRKGFGNLLSFFPFRG